MMLSKLILSFFIIPLILFSEENALILQCKTSQNLLQNADFCQLDGNGLPLRWTFDNCSRSPIFKSQIVKQSKGNYLTVDTAWSQFGYWMQTIPLQKGESYYVSSEVQSDGPNVMIWIQCKQNISDSEKPSVKEFRAPIFLSNGLSMKKELRDFVDEKLLNSLCADQWSRIGCVVNVPKDDGSYLCEVRIGVYGGGPGQMRFRNPLFRKAQVELQADINGTGWTELQVGKATPESIKLDPSLEHQSVSFVLPKAKFIYRVELIGNHGQKIIREFTND
ncbi:MAG: hypothetical protein J6X55_18090 [Victivallales bacterium]|nr:hypothetical protein [Victivallales bacterium]